MPRKRITEEFTNQELHDIEAMALTGFIELKCEKRYNRLVEYRLRNSLVKLMKLTPAQD